MRRCGCPLRGGIDGPDCVSMPPRGTLSGLSLPVANFKNPPVGEVSFGLGFSPLPGFKVAHFGAFWDLIRKDYPECEDKAPLFDASSPPAVIPDWFPFPRVWYVHRERNFLVQLQPNKIWLNWRRLNEAEAYPRFEKLFPIFADLVGLFTKFAEGNNLGQLMTTGADLSYVNHIPSAGSPSPYTDAAEFVQDLRSAQRRYLPSPDGIAFRTEFTIGDDKLSVDLKSGRERVEPQRPIFILEIRAWASLKPERDTEPLKWFTHANELIVNAFCDVTTVKAQREHWQRID
jgi:uncharacterized protein (TIGR04255 family)